MKPTRAWAVVDDEGNCSPEYEIWNDLESATRDCVAMNESENRSDYRVIEVLITPVDDQADEIRGKR